MFERSLLPRAIALGLCGAVFVLPRVSTAQVVIPAGTTGGSVIHTGLQISDDELHSLVEKNFTDVLLPGAEQNHVVLVVDANGEFVSGRATKSTVIHRTFDGEASPQVVTVRDSSGGAAATVMIHRSEGSAVTATPTGAGASLFVASSGIAGAGPARAGVLGTGISAADVGSMTTRNIPAGQWRNDAITVTVLKLK